MIFFSGKVSNGSYNLILPWILKIWLFLFSKEGQLLFILLQQLTKRPFFFLFIIIPYYNMFGGTDPNLGP